MHDRAVPPGARGKERHALGHDGEPRRDGGEDGGNLRRDAVVESRDGRGPQQCLAHHASARGIMKVVAHVRARERDDKRSAAAPGQREASWSCAIGVKGVHEGGRGAGGRFGEPGIVRTLHAHVESLGAQATGDARHGDGVATRGVDGNWRNEDDTRAHGLL